MEAEVPQKVGHFNRSDSELFPEVTELDSDIFFDAEEDVESEMNAIMLSAATSVAVVPEPSSSIDSACPFWVDIISNRGKYTRAFAVNFGSQTSYRSIKDCEELVKTGDASSFVEMNFSPRMSSKEKLRRMVGYVLVHPENANAGPQKLKDFMEKQEKFRNVLLRRAEPTLVGDKKVRESLKWSGFTAHSVSDRHWVEEWTTINTRTNSIDFYHPEKKRPSNRIMLSSILQVRSLPSEMSPTVFGYYFLVIETLGRSVYLMLGSESERDALVELIPRLKVLQNEEEGAIHSTASNESNFFWPFENPVDEFLHDSTVWSCKNRRILNCGKFFFRSHDSVEDPLSLVGRSLRLALGTDSSSSDVVEQRHAFLMSAADLKQANLKGLSENAKLTFFLNLYHVMVVHASLVLGPPDSSFRWLSYFNNIAYVVDDDIFSLAELEHCIIRANMTYPSQFLSRFALPKSQYSTRMVLREGDYRINFALNCGSLSNPSKVMIFDVDKLSDQLNYSARMYFMNTPSVKQVESGIIIYIPRVCLWFLADFGNPEDLVRKIEPFLREGDREVLAKYRSSVHSNSFDMDSITIRYLQYNFECRTLELAAEADGT